MPPAPRTAPILTRNLTVQTVPPIAGVTFRFMDRTFATGANGVATLNITLGERNLLAHDRASVLSVTTSTVHLDSTHLAEFAEWQRTGIYRWSPTDPIGAIETAVFKITPLATNPPSGRHSPVLTRNLTVRTVPPAPGVTFQFLDRTFATGADGIATLSITVDERNQLAHDRAAALSVVSPTVRVDATHRATFAGWFGNGTYRWSPTDPVGALETATFSTDRLVTFRFADQHGSPISTDRVQRFEIQSNTGAHESFAPGTGRWLKSTDVAVGSAGPVNHKLSYSIMDAQVQRTNLVNAGQQRFTPADRAAITVKLLFFHVTFHASDAIFGTPSRGRMVLTLPDGSTRSVELRNGRVTLVGLPRGLYQISIKGPGPASTRPVAISSSKVIQVDVVTWRDIATGLGILVTAAVSVLIAAFLLRRRHARRTRPNVTSQTPQPTHIEREPMDVLH